MQADDDDHKLSYVNDNGTIPTEFPMQCETLLHFCVG